MGEKAAKADKSKRPASYDLNAAGRRRDLLVRIGLTAIVLLFAVVLVGYIVISHDKKTAATAARSVRVTSSKLVTQDGKPKAVITFYEDFLCPACGNFERTFGPTVSNLIDTGAIAADYYMVGLLSRPQNDDYSSRAGNAAYCVADESIDAFRRFHTALYTKEIQPSETGTTFPNNAKLIEIAREAGVVGKVPDCVNSGKYTKMVDGLATSAGIHATPTVRINGED
jgi:protein-disulfide isomerase